MQKIKTIIFNCNRTSRKYTNIRDDKSIERTYYIKKIKKVKVKRINRIAQEMRENADN